MRAQRSKEGSALAGGTPRPPLWRRLTYFSPLGIVLLFLLTSPAFLRTDFLSLLTKIVIFALLAMGLDLVFGYSGLWSFGHAGLFGVAAYTVAILIVKVGFTNFWAVAPISVAMAGIMAALWGVLGLRSKEIYFMLVTFAFGMLISVAARVSQRYTEGSSGLWNIPYPDLGFGPAFTKTSYYYFVLIVVAICAVLLHRVTKSPFGYSLMGIRDNETRAKALGYNTWLRRLLAFVLSGLFAGVAGVLYVYFNRGISPDQVGLDYSGLVIIMVIVGGVGTLWGGAVGAVVVLLLQYVVSLYTSARWPLFLGCIFIAAVFLAKDGIFPNFVKLWKRVCGYEVRGGGPSEAAPEEMPPFEKGS